MSEDFNEKSADAMFTRILAEIKADRVARTAFRKEVRNRFAAGTLRMNEQDGILAEIKEQTTRTNGRVTKLENERRLLLAKIAGASLVISALATAAIWLYEHGVRLVF